MSTMLKTAAMTLLSKTLQTFLYKYLSDVDVEGVALPSVYDGSGWGVRLSNVKLREGVELMKELPGKVKRKRRKKKKKEDRTNNNNKEQQRVGKQQQQSEAASSVGVAATNQEPNNEVHQQNGENEQEQSSGFRSTDQEEEMDGSIHVADLQRKSSIDYMEKDDDGAPSTPEQNSKSIFSCFHASRSAVNNANNSQGGNDQQQPRSLPEISLHEKSGTERRPPERVESELTFETESFSDRETVDLVHRIDAALEDETRVNDESEEEEEYEEYEEYEQPLKLSLGENGRIGTLDIR
jgi:hypothetical protein